MSAWRLGCMLQLTMLLATRAGQPKQTWCACSNCQLSGCRHTLSTCMHALCDTHAALVCPAAAQAKPAAPAKAAPEAKGLPSLEVKKKKAPAAAAPAESSTA